MKTGVRTSSIIGLCWLLAGGCDRAPTFPSARSPAPVDELPASSQSATSAATPPAPAPPIEPDLFLAPAPVADAAHARKTRPAATADPEPDRQQPRATATPADSAEAAQVPAPAEPDNGGHDRTAAGGYSLLGAVVPPGTLQQLTWTATETFTGTDIPTAVMVVNGHEPGPTLCLTAAVHGDELNGIETVRRVVHDIKPEKLTGTLIAVPIVNLEAFHRHSRYLPDRRDLNRFFPGNPKGSSASRIAYSFFNDVIRHCDGLVDLHTGSFHRTNLPQLRADLNIDAVVELTKGFGATVTLHSEGEPGTLRRAAVDAGIPAVTLEAGAPLQVQDADVKHAVKSIHALLDKMDMYNKRGFWGNPEPVYYTSRWVRADSGGVMFGEVKLGKRVRAGDRLGTVTDPITNQTTEIISPFTGRVLGMALDQFVMPGFATFHIGIETEVDEATEGGEDVELEHAVAVYEPERNQNE